MRSLAIIALCASWSSVCGQVPLEHRLRFVPFLSGRPLALESPMVFGDDVPVTLSTFRFYAGHFAGCHGGVWSSLGEEYRLIDASDTATLDVDFATAPASLDSISFLLGVDSLTNVSGAFGGDLDPIKGMYWAWNSGYINLKLEGTSPVSPYASHTFELHLGGYLPPFDTAQRVALPLHADGPWTVKVDVAPLLAAADPRTRCNVMSPGEQAVRLSRVAVQLFKSDAPR